MYSPLASVLSHFDVTFAWGKFAIGMIYTYISELQSVDQDFVPKHAIKCLDFFS